MGVEIPHRWNATSVDVAVGALALFGAVSLLIRLKDLIKRASAPFFSFVRSGSQAAVCFLKAAFDCLLSLTGLRLVSLREAELEKALAEAHQKIGQQSAKIDQMVKTLSAQTIALQVAYDKDFVSGMKKVGDGEFLFNFEEFLDAFQYGGCPTLYLKAVPWAGSGCTWSVYVGSEQDGMHLGVQRRGKDIGRKIHAEFDVMDVKASGTWYFQKADSEFEYKSLQFKRSLCTVRELIEKVKSCGGPLVVKVNSWTSLDPQRKSRGKHLRFFNFLAGLVSRATQVEGGGSWTHSCADSIPLRFCS
uniref:Uncharacterized protein n=1 Tax=Chromera velia CCMP2878 TaxID=1169474 RepID=A0A0G4HBC4_9ALVE|eukprot:Cvel_25943.t1-p1 / transcript=Cvel_25943.t1 / gene=Cvel_25943 / organism=Chromera_velia_CCMP2878 / gene_product=hypothetical protein / transcript_product=hypothetical protein / location=Cvel_scaffold3005:14308-15619(+) / protein_length=302 / sequence_SO=supercontig / SO=protein_coding / is_pseudo=false